MKKFGKTRFGQFLERPNRFLAKVKLGRRRTKFDVIGVQLGGRRNSAVNPSVPILTVSCDSRILGRKGYPGYHHFTDALKQRLLSDSLGQ